MQLISQSLKIFVSLTVLTGVVYPLCITGLSQLFFPHQANGSLIVSKTSGKVLGSELIGQQFSSPKYFWGRPSATSPYPYNAAASSGSNLGPSNPELLKQVKERSAYLGPELNKQQDLLSSSASGLDPHISVLSAEAQVHRVAEARKLAVDEVRALVGKFTEDRQFGFMGEPRVNVLRLNLALDDRE